jgi:ribosome-associated translation inhibitor RaiA
MRAQTDNSGVSDSFSVEIRSPDFPLTDAIRQYAMQHLATKLGKHAHRIGAVVMRFEDANGTKGGEDKVCRVEVLLPRDEPLVVEEINHDLRAAIDLAADRIVLAVERDLDRRRSLPRQRGRKLVRHRKLLS